MDAKEVFDGVLAWSLEYDKEFYNLLNSNADYAKSFFAIGRGILFDDHVVRRISIKEKSARFCKAAKIIRDRHRNEGAARNFRYFFKKMQNP